MQITDYLPYGKERITQRNSDYKNKYGFIGKEKDNESGLNYVEARYYDSGLGRFVAQDRMFWEVGQTKRGMRVMMDPQQMNSYGYARNNPIVLKDPSGEDSCVSCWFEYTFNSLGAQGFTNVNQKVQQEGKAYKEAGEIATTTVLQNAPGTGDAGDAYTLATGKDPYTGKDVTWDYRVLGGIGAFIPGVSGGGLRTGASIAKKALSNESRVQHAFEHFKDVFGNWNKQTGTQFKELLTNIITNADNIIHKAEVKGSEQISRYTKQIGDTIYKVDIFTSGDKEGLIRTATKDVIKK